MRRLNILTAALVLALGSAPAALATPWLFDTLPASGDVSGPAGTAVGWGYEIENPDTGLWLVLTGLDTDAFAHGTPDGSIFDFPVLAPGTSLSVPFDPIGFTGLFQLTWDASAPVGFVNWGTFVLHAEWWDGDPLAGGVLVEAAPDGAAPYSATVQAIPEPATGMLLLVGAAALARVRGRSG